MGAYDAAGKRNSSKAHARIQHVCDICGATSHGNGGKVSHARRHVRAGEAIELVKWYSTMASPSRVFLPTADPERCAVRLLWFQGQGYTIEQETER